MSIVRIEPRFVARPWGSTDLSPWFAPPPAEKTGEVWFDAGPLLIKFLFTCEALSVQVHPGDDYARDKENSPGKTEMWHVLRAQPGARIALGFRNPVTKEQVRSAALDGSIENLLSYHPASAGDTFFTPAGAVHALGAGLVVCEIQQNSDVTYRLHDYNRLPRRPLHLDKSLDVLDLSSHPGKSPPSPLPSGGALLARCSYFAAERHEPASPFPWPGGVMIVLEGSGKLETPGGTPLAPGEVWNVARGVTLFPSGRVVVLRAYVPSD